MSDFSSLNYEQKLKLFALGVARQREGRTVSPMTSRQRDEGPIPRPLPPLPAIVNFDWKNPDYDAVFEQRDALLGELRADRRLLERFRQYYRHAHADFIADWGVTFDPRNLDIGLDPFIPFVPFPRQREWIDYILRKWRARERGLTDKSRECGVSWLAVSLSCQLCIFNFGAAIGFGSKLARDVDAIGDPKSLFEKARIFMRNLPAEFRAGWTERDAPEFRIKFPATGSVIVGEGGDEIGRGGRNSIYFVDETAKLKHPKLVDAALSQTTNCRQDISTPAGMANPFAELRHSGRVEVFTFSYLQDPRKGSEWRQKQVENIVDPVIIAQEIDIDYTASADGIIIPQEWVQSARDAHVRLGIVATGRRGAALDVADGGVDLNAISLGTGILVEHVEEWSGKGSDPFATVERAFLVCDEHGVTEMRYDAGGPGAAVSGDGRVINERRKKQMQPRIALTPFVGSAAVYNPEGQDVKGRTNKDFFKNRKSQGWWGLRTRFMLTHRWVTEGKPCPPDRIISISSGIPADVFTKLANQLAQVTWSLDGSGKIAIDKAPDGIKSPDLGDSVMIKFAPMAAHFDPSPEVLQRLTGGAGPGRNRMATVARNRFARAR
jgi:phage terminase large subunit